MRSNGGLLGPRNLGQGGCWRVDDQQRGGIILPTTEAAADSNTFVCEFTGGASANEAGAGGGLSGVDLVLTQNGSIGAAAGGGRSITGAQYFTCTAALLAALLNGGEWAIMRRIIGMYTSSGSMWNFELDEESAKQSLVGYQCGPTGYVLGQLTRNTPARYNAQLGGTPVMTAAFDGWDAFWLKDGIFHFGVKRDPAPPTGWESFATGDRAAQKTDISFAGYAWSGLRQIIGTTGSPAMKIGTLVVSKLGLSSAPI